MVTVLVPTYNRPHFLQTVLDSIRRQTACNLISKIIVSENGSSLESAIICKKNNDLKIEFVKQNPQVSAVEHLTLLFRQVNTKYAAMLHDDDWWYPTHLEIALNSLESHLNSCCYFSNFFFAENALLKNLSTHHSNVLSYIDLPNSELRTIELTFAQICTLCYLYTPFHFSSIVGRSENLKISAEDVLRTAKPYYADRILFPSLAKQGTLLFNPELLVGVRKHKNNGELDLQLAEKHLSHQEGSKRIFQIAKENGFDILENWSKIKRRLSDDQWNEIIAIYNGYFGPKPVDDVFVPLINLSTQRQPRTIKEIIRNMLPYGFVRYYATKNR